MIGSENAIICCTDMTLVGKARARAAVSKAAGRERGEPRAHVVPDRGKGAIEGCIMIGGIEWRGRDMRQDPMTTEATGELGESSRVNVGWPRGGAAGKVQHREASSGNGLIKGKEGGVTKARCDGAEKVTQARVNAEANEEITFIRGIHCIR